MYLLQRSGAVFEPLSAGSEVRVPLGESIWILANDFGENPQNPFKDSVKINCENQF